MDLDDVVIANQVLATHHDLNGNINSLDADFIINFAENILNPITVSREVEQGMLITQKSIQDFREVEKDMPMPQAPIQKELSYQITQLSFEVAFKSLNNDADCHSATMCLLSILSTYPWEAKAVMMLAAFSLICGDFITISPHSHGKKLANKLTLFKKNLIAVPSEKLSDDSIVKFIIDLVKCVIELNQPSSFSPPQPLILATYWITRSCFAYTRRIFGVKSKTDIIEESTLIAKSKSILSTCYSLLEAKRTEKSYKALLHAFSHSLNNLQVLKLIFNVKDDKDWIFFDPWPAYRRLGVGTLKNERVRLVIVSGTNVSEAGFLSRQLSKLETNNNVWTVWIPIIDDIEFWITQKMQYRLRKVLEFGLMVRDPQERIKPQFIRFIKEKYFPAFLNDGNPIVISLDNCGKLVHTNALHMILTWRDDLAFSRVFVQRGYNIISLLKKELAKMTLGVDSVIDDIEERISNLVGDINQKIHDWRNNINEKIENSNSSYNYTSKKEKEFWDEETWNLELLVRKTRNWSEFDIDNQITLWIKKRSDIFLCGGNDSRCAQEFATKVKEFNFKTQLEIKFAYIGKNMKVKSLIENISDYVLSSNEEYFWFWTRLQSAFLSRVNYLNKIGRDDSGDKIVRGLQQLLAYEAKGSTVGGWVLFSKGEEVIVCDFGDKMLKVMSKIIQEWKSNVYNKAFSQAFKDCYENLASSSQDHHAYCTLEYPYTLDKIPEDVNCPRCSCNMHKFVTFTCCHDHDIWS